MGSSTFYYERWKEENKENFPNQQNIRNKKDPTQNVIHVEKQLEFDRYFFVVVVWNSLLLARLFQRVGRQVEREIENIEQAKRKTTYLRVSIFKDFAIKHFITKEKRKK